MLTTRQVCKKKINFSILFTRENKTESWILECKFKSKLLTVKYLLTVALTTSGATLMFEKTY